jgi:hypothetical protein
MDYSRGGPELAELSPAPDAVVIPLDGEASLDDVRASAAFDVPWLDTRAHTVTVTVRSACVNPHAARPQRNFVEDAHPPCPAETSCVGPPRDIQPAVRTKPLGIADHFAMVDQGDLGALDFVRVRAVEPVVVLEHGRTAVRPTGIRAHLWGRSPKRRRPAVPMFPARDEQE